MVLLSDEGKKFYQRTRRKIIIDRSHYAGYDKSKVECFICIKWDILIGICEHLGDGAGFDWSDMAEEKIQANMALMVFLDSEEIALLKRSVWCKEYELGLLRTELEKVKQEKEGVDFKIAKFDKSAKDLNEMLESLITGKSKKGVGYNAVPLPHPLILNRPKTLDLSYSGLEEFKEPEVNEYGLKDSV
ncbi:hypothetical protein Tco_1123789 [Tanacetum coccineum]|uniref:Uncharacterized protein n=1 Tax=Tanacetum coccineum TaxID=301880 RepID=A0ABQ5J4E8_9ASTR